MKREEYMKLNLIGYANTLNHMNIDEAIKEYNGIKNNI